MHVLVRETRALDEIEQAVDLGQTPADLVFLSFSDSDLGAASAAWQADATLPGLRLANLARLKHPLSVDLYVEQVIETARCVVIRLLGGLDYWRYGAEEVARVCRVRAIPLAILPGDGREDDRLIELSTVDPGIRARLDACFAHGGPENTGRALRVAAHLAGLGPDDGERAEPLPMHGEYRLPGRRSPAAPTPTLPHEGGGSDSGIVSTGGSTPSPAAGGNTTGATPGSAEPPPPSWGRVGEGARPEDGRSAPRTGTRAPDGDPGHPRPLAVIVFYRAYLLAADLAPVDALARDLDRRGLDVRALYVASLKAPDTAAFVARNLRDWRPAVILNATGFSARLDPDAGNDGASPLDAAGVPVLQLVLSGSAREAWAESARGLSQADLAMQVVLPELDGRLLATAISFKAEEAEIAGLEFARTVHTPDPDGITLAADRAAGWARLAATGRGNRRIALILSDYPGAAGQAAHAVGLDAIESTAQILGLLDREGYATGAAMPDGKAVVAALCDAEPTPFLSLADYRRLFATLPKDTRARIVEAWGAPEDDPAVAGGAFALPFGRYGNVITAIQPDRGSALQRKDTYHDPDLPPRHAYVAFYLWLRECEAIHAIVHLGTHGTLEWLPGKAVALSGACVPTALIRGLPLIYPFIVNNPGEAAAAKRRLGAVTIGHLTPPLKLAGSHGAATELERLIDEFAAADGLDRRRTAILKSEILERADEVGLLAESGATADMSEDDRLACLDAYLCDVKDLQIRDGLHVFGAVPGPEQRAALSEALRAACPDLPPEPLDARLDASPEAERQALLAALDGHFVLPGPSGAPTRGRADVLPTGRNLFAVDPRAVPTRSALVLAEKAADDLVRRHLQDHGDWPRSVVIDLWGSATMRTGGEDLALALVLIGARPTWDTGSNRVNGFEILPLAMLDRPRIDVTLRVSGMFRDAFEAQIALFDAVVRAVAERDEDDQWNPVAAKARGLTGEALRKATARIYGAAPGSYGAGVTHLVEAGAWDERADLGNAYLSASAHAYGQGLDGARDADGFAERVRATEAFVHQQDHAEIDLLDTVDFAAHEGGFAAAAEALGASPALYHADTSNPEKPKTRTVAEEVTRVVRGRAANPEWIAGMMRHGYRGGSEIARSLEGLYGFAATLPDRLDRQFDLVFDATLGDETVDRFLRAENPAARAAMVARFDEAIRRGLWRPRRNAVAAILAGGEP